MLYIPLIPAGLRTSPSDIYTAYQITTSYHSLIIEMLLRKSNKPSFQSGLPETSKS